MKSLFKSNLSWFVLLYLFGLLITSAMEENKTKINSYSMNQLQNDFIGLKKNPQKYVEFQLNAENTTHPDAGGLYELLPYYQKINPLGEKAHYSIQWCDFGNKWKLIKVNPLGDLPRLDVEETTIATLLEGNQFSRPTKDDIKAYITYEQMKSVVKMVGEKNKELKMKIIELEDELVRVNTKVNNKIFLTKQENKKLEETLTKIEKQNKKLKAYIIEQKNVTKKANEQKQNQDEKNQESLNQIETLILNIKKKEIQIEKKDKEKQALELYKGDLEYKLSNANEFKHKFVSLEKEVKPLKAQIKNYQGEIQKWGIKASDVEKMFNQQVAEIQILTQDLNSYNIECEKTRNIFNAYKKKLVEEIKKIQWNWKNYVEESKVSIQQADISKFDDEKLKTIIDSKPTQLQEEIFCLNKLLDKQTKVIKIQEDNINFKDTAIEFLLKQFQTRLDDFLINPPQVNEIQNSDSSSNSPPQTHNY